MDGFQFNLVHLFSINARCAILNICLDLSKVKVTLQGHAEIPSKILSWRWISFQRYNLLIKLMSTMYGVAQCNNLYRLSADKSVKKRT